MLRKLPMLLAIVAVLSFATPLLAPPTLDEVFKSVNQSMEQRTDTRPLLAAFAAIFALLLLLVVVNQRGRKTVAKVKSSNHPHKLTREVLKAAGIRRSELRQLKLLAEAQNLSSPLTLLLCPSLLARGIKDPGIRADRQVLAALGRRLLDQSKS